MRNRIHIAGIIVLMLLSFAASGQHIRHNQLRELTNEKSDSVMFLLPDGTFGYSSIDTTSGSGAVDKVSSLSFDSPKSADYLFGSLNFSFQINVGDEHMASGVLEYDGNEYTIHAIDKETSSLYRISAINKSTNDLISIGVNDGDTLTEYNFGSIIVYYY